jgi:hypothetical protein
MSELQNLVTFLLSEGCNYLTGQTIAIDGGQHLAGPSTFADLSHLNEAQWQAARVAVQRSTERNRAQAPA